MMGRFTVRLPRTLHQEIDQLAKGEGISLNQYIVYALTEKVTLEKLVLGQDGEQKELTPEKARLLANIRLIPPEQVAEQYVSFEALLSGLGVPASDEEVEQYLSEREPVQPEPDLKPEAVIQLRERIAQAKQVS